MGFYSPLRSIFMRGWEADVEKNIILLLGLLSLSSPSAYFYWRWQTAGSEQAAEREPPDTHMGL